MLRYSSSNRLSKIVYSKSNTKTMDCQWKRQSLIEKGTSTTEYPSPEMILAGEVCQDAFQNAERAKVEENAVQVKQGRRAGTGTVHGRRTLRKGGSVSIVPAKRKTAELLQQLSGALRFGKRRLHLQTV